mgnify:CR=1 FL=1
MPLLRGPLPAWGVKRAGRATSPGPGWKAVPKTAAELDETVEERVASDVRWTPSLARGLAVGAVAGAATYAVVIFVLPYVGQIQMVQ